MKYLSTADRLDFTFEAENMFVSETHFFVFLPPVPNLFNYILLLASSLSSFPPLLFFSPVQQTMCLSCVNCVISHVPSFRSASSSLRSSTSTCTSTSTAISTCARLNSRLQYRITCSSSLYKNQHRLHHLQTNRVRSHQQKKTSFFPSPPNVNQLPQSIPPTSQLPISLIPVPYSRLFSSSQKCKNREMSSDEAYMSFLDKANKDLSSTTNNTSKQAAGSVRTVTVDMNARIPAPLQSVDAYYVSETDEPFEPVVLKWEGAEVGKWPSSGTSFSGILCSSLPNLSYPVLLFYS